MASRLLHSTGRLTIWLWFKERVTRDVNVLYWAGRLTMLLLDMSLNAGKQHTVMTCNEM